MTERDRLLRKKQDAEELCQLLESRVRRAQQAQIRETRFEEQERLEQVLLDARRRLQDAESELSDINAQLAKIAGESSPIESTQQPAAEAWSSTPAPRTTPSRAELRHLLDGLFASDADLDAFVIDYCAEVQRRFTVGMERVQKLNLLLLHVPEQELLSRLRLHSPSEVSRLLGGKQ